MRIIVQLLLAIVHAISFLQISPVPDEWIKKSVVVFDLDNTLYRTRTNFKDLTLDYIQERTRVDRSSALKLLKRYRTDYDALVVRGLIDEYGINPADFESYIDSRSNLVQVIKPDTRLQKLVKSIKGPRYVLTNSGRTHASTALKALGLYDDFHGLVYVDYAKQTFYGKPDKRIYEDAMGYFGVDEPSRIFFVDDTHRYAQAAKELGWNAIHYYPESRTCHDPNVPCIKSLYDLPRIAPDVF